MKKPPHESSCQDKQRVSEQEARRRARILNDQQFQPVHAYPCSYCNTHHVGDYDPTIDEEVTDEEAKAALPEPNPVSISLEELYRWAQEARARNEHTPPDTDG
ncbi:hypothetical protein BRC20_01150 [Candidatus Saccharibacteria bacterium QS_8_54_8]|nr:MAG: hypothetical protein BRC20_01150 [Candidatus Saccharibacteria bacterium QS_8_54_8]